MTSTTTASKNKNHVNFLSNTGFLWKSQNKTKKCRQIITTQFVEKDSDYFKLVYQISKFCIFQICIIELTFISYLKGMHWLYTLHYDKIAWKVDFGLKKVPFPNCITKILLLWHGCPLTLFFSGPNRVKGGLPVIN